MGSAEIVMIGMVTVARFRRDCGWSAGGVDDVNLGMNQFIRERRKGLEALSGVAELEEGILAFHIASLPKGGTPCFLPKHRARTTPGGGPPRHVFPHPP